MLLPTKHISEQHALVSIGAIVISHLIKEDVQIQKLWDSVRKEKNFAGTPLSFEWFVLALDFLFMVSIIDVSDDKVLWVTR